MPRICHGLGRLIRYTEDGAEEAEKERGERVVGCWLGSYLLSIDFYLVGHLPARRTLHEMSRSLEQ